MRFVWALFCLVLTETHASTAISACGERLSTTAKSITLQSTAIECLYFLDNAQVALTGSGSPTLETGETIKFIKPSSSGASAKTISAAAYSDFYADARSIVVYKSAGSGSSDISVQYASSYASTATLTTLSDAIACGGVISAASGSFNQPSGTGALECFWIFTQPSSKVITLSASGMATTGACATEYLEINTFTASDSRMTNKFCTGNIANSKIVTDSKVVIRYVVGSSGPTTMTFTLNYEVTDPPTTTTTNTTTNTTTTTVAPNMTTNSSSTNVTMKGSADKPGLSRWLSIVVGSIGAMVAQELHPF